MAEVNALDDWLEDRFGLTTAESRLAVALFRGLSLRQYSTLRGTSVHTARVQLASIFVKVGVKRQADLLLLIMTAGPRSARGARVGPSTPPETQALAG